MKKIPAMLMILDGFGLNDSTYGNAVAAAETPNLDRIFSTYPNVKINASGLAVGLPEGQMGNSEVGHLNIGAGRIVYQELTKITKSIDDGDFFENTALNDAINHVEKNKSTLHIFGLLSDGGVHSHIKHIKAVLLLAKQRNLKTVYLHCFLDGRDVPPTSALEYVKEIEDYMQSIGIGKIGVISGRYYAMDRDKRWERLKLAYDALTLGEGCDGSLSDGKNSPACTAIEKSYSDGDTDEFIMPTVCCKNSTIKSGDSIIFCNFRPDRAREITRAFTDNDFDEYAFKRTAVADNLCYTCMTQYDASIKNVLVAFPPHKIENTLGEYLASQGLSQLRIAETEKYAHVTFFFNGGVESPNTNEDRILIPSPKVATYDLQPEMSASEITKTVIAQINDSKYDCIILNFANADMVGHTGVFDAAVKAIETLDGCVASICEAVLDAGGQLLITADHGNADNMLDENGNVVTAHSTNQVPLVHVAASPAEFTEEAKSGKGKLADIAPTLLTLMGLAVPDEMSGNCLIKA